MKDKHLPNTYVEYDNKDSKDRDIEGSADVALEFADVALTEYTQRTHITD